MKTDIQIAQEATMLPIKEVTAKIGLTEDDLELYGKYKAKISNEYWNKIKDNEDGTKQFVITSKTDIDLRKKLFEVLPKEEITIFELKKTETSLEDAFIKLIDTEKEEEK